MIDTGVERAIFQDPERALIRGIVAEAAGIDRMRARTDTATWVASQREPIAGVLLTHLHLDHVSGLRDIPRDVPVYTGPGEAGSRSALGLATQSIVDAALEGRGPVREWQPSRDERGAPEGVIDVLGDGTLWAIPSPGHTPGSTAYLARTPRGPVLFTGDVCHTAWGWEHDVTPGTFTEDHAGNAESLATLRALAARHPSIEVRLGHQELR